MIDINTLIKLCKLENFEITMHAAKRLEQRGITIGDIMSSIQTGEVIEQYPEDYPYPSCLVLGISTGQKMLHVVIGTDLETLWIITAYYPDPNKWEDDFKTRKEN